MLKLKASTAKTNTQQGNPATTAHSAQSGSHQPSESKHQEGKVHKLKEFLSKEEHKLEESLKKDAEEANADPDKYAGLM